MGFESLPGSLDEGRGLEPVTSEDVAALRAESQESEDAEREADVAALKLVLQNIALAEAYQGSKRLPEEINRIEDLYRAWVAPRNWPNSNQPRAHLGMPLVLEAVENVISQVHMAFWSDPQPFLLLPTGKTTLDAAHAKATVLKWALKEAGAKEEFRKALKSTLLYQQGVLRWNWQQKSHEKVSYKRSANGKVTRHPEKCDLSIPCLDFWELRRVFVDPGLRNHDIRNANWVGVQWFTTAEGLQDLINAGYKNIPEVDGEVDLDTLAVILADQQDEPTVDSATGNKVETWREYQALLDTEKRSADPMQQNLEVLEIVTNDAVYAVLQRKLVIRREDNNFGRINFNSCAFIDVLGSWYGFGIGKLLEGDQRFITGVVNAWIDGLSLSLQPVWHRKKGLGQNSQNIMVSPGRVVNDDGDLAQLEMKGNTPEALGAIEAAEARATRRVAANAGSEMPTQAMRTAEGVNSFTGGIQTRLQYFIDIWSDLVFIPILEAFLQLCMDNLQPEDIDRILTEEDGKAWEGDILDIYNATHRLDVLTSTKLAAKRAMAGLVPSLMQLFMAEPVAEALAAQGKKLDFVEFIETVGDLTGWPMDGLIVDATPEDIQRYMQMQPGVMAAQAQQKVQQQKQQDALEQIEAKGLASAGNKVVAHVLKESSAQMPQATAPLAEQLESGGQPAPAQPLALQPPQGPGTAPPEQAGTPQATAPQGQVGGGE